MVSHLHLINEPRSGHYFWPQYFSFSTERNVPFFRIPSHYCLSYSTNNFGNFLFPSQLFRSGFVLAVAYFYYYIYLPSPSMDISFLVSLHSLVSVVLSCSRTPSDLFLNRCLSHVTTQVDLETGIHVNHAFFKVRIDKYILSEPFLLFCSVYQYGRVLWYIYDNYQFSRLFGFEGRFILFS